MKRFFALLMSLSVIPAACSQGSTKLGETVDPGAGAGAGAGGEDPGTVPDPCANKPCGAQCSLCSPGGPCSNIATYCDATGICTVEFPTCEAAECQSSDECPQPGAACQECPDGTLACPSVTCVLGQCVGSFPTCQGTTCSDDTDCPQSLAPCQQCPDGSAACPWSRCEAGSCVSGVDTCDGTTEPNPCEGKMCGDSCHPCDGIPGCLGPPVIMTCDENQICQTGTVSCDGGCVTDTDCPGVGACSPCPDGMSCAENLCIDGKCQFSCGTEPPMCAAKGASCAAGETCCDGLTCCAGVPVPAGEEYCSDMCPDSDVNIKQNFASLNQQVILDKLASMPLSTWSYKTEEGEVRHIGPMAQDFMAAFQVGASDKAIEKVDADGVSFAAIQALYVRLQEVERQNAELSRELQEIKRTRH